jgi:fermentation-respiration switch protein FrsA (DUF1100 family)
MKPLFCAACILLSSLILPSPAHAQKAGIATGLWQGSLVLQRASEGGSPPGASQAGSLESPMTLRLLPPGKGALIDIEAQSMYGYPLDEVSWTADRLKFRFDALGPGEEMSFEGIYASIGTGQPAGAAGEGSIVGTARSPSWKASFRLKKVPGTAPPGEEPLDVVLPDAVLPGTLQLPSSGSSGAPLILLLAGAGSTDRNGNNFNVPGRTDSLAQLAARLAAKGVASWRWDKRGSGESYLYESGERRLSLAVHVSDTAQAITQAKKLKGFSRIIVSGMNEGAWIGAAALNSLAGDARAIPVADGFAGYAVSGEAPEHTLAASISTLDDATRKEAASILRALLAGRPFSAPSAALADFFAPSRLDWLRSWLAFTPAREIGALRMPVLLVYGEKDMQVSRKAFELLLEARPLAIARIIPGMNHVLKSVEDEEENYASFTDPGYEVPPAFVDLLAAFAKARPAPPGSQAYAAADQ